MRTIMFAALALGIAAPLQAQNCPSGILCNEARIAAITQARTGIGLSAGNPILGASSTLGLRLGAMPRITVSARVSGVRLSIPNAETTSTTDELNSIARSMNVDAAVGI